MKIIKKIVGIVAALAMLAVASPAMADDDIALYNNHKDSGWDTYLTPWQGISQTPNRQKQDASYGYIKPTKLNGYRIRAWMTRMNGESVGSEVKVLSQGQEGFISQYAYERFGRVQVRMKLQNVTATSANVPAAGVWSPDSV